jgi:hypothetical protein
MAQLDGWQLCWSSGHQNDLLEVSAPWIPRSCNTLVCLRLCQPSWAPRMRDLLRSVCSCSPVSLLWTPRILCQNEGLSRGCAPDGPTKYFWVLGRYTLETFLRSACLEWLCQTLCSYAGYLGVSTHHTFKINILLWLHRPPTPDIATSVTT